MRRYHVLRIMLVLLIAVPCCFQACIKDKCKGAHIYTYLTPIYKPKEDVKNNIKSNEPRPIENPGKICVVGNTIFLNEIDKGIHVIDNSNPSQPKNAAFIDIPGNLDIAVKGNALYADFYTDLVTLDITDPAHVSLKKVVENLFPNRSYAFQVDHQQVIIGWQRHDTTVIESCDHQDYAIAHPVVGIYLTTSDVVPGLSSSQNTAIGVTGSMSRLTIMNDRLYAVNNTELSILNISNLLDPNYVNHITAGWGIETIYPFKDKLFIGSTNGMFIYNVSNPDAPTQVGQFSHLNSCDPVIADDQYAYVTLSSGTFCGGNINELNVVKLNNYTDAVLQKRYTMTNPRGLSKDGNLLFICDGTGGLKVYNSDDVNNILPVKTIGNMETYDVIAYNHWALVVAKDGLYQYDYSNTADIRLLSKMGIQK